MLKFAFDCHEVVTGYQYSFVRSVYTLDAEQLRSILHGIVSSAPDYADNFVLSRAELRGGRSQLRLNSINSSKLAIA